MNVDPSVFTASRRGAELLRAWSTNDRDAVNAVLGELRNGDDTVRLILGLCTAAELLGWRVFGEHWPAFLVEHRDAMDMASWSADLPAVEPGGPT